MITSHPLAGSHFHSFERHVRSARTGYNSTGIRNACCHITKRPNNKQAVWQEISPRHCACGAEAAPGQGSRPAPPGAPYALPRACGPVTRTSPDPTVATTPSDPCIALRAVGAGSPRRRRWDSPWTTHHVAHRLPPPCPHSLHRQSSESAKRCRQREEPRLAFLSARRAGVAKGYGSARTRGTRRFPAVGDLSAVRSPHR